MAIVLESATRLNPVPCQHFRVRLNVDAGARTRDVDIASPDILEPIMYERILVMVAACATSHRG